MKEAVGAKVAAKVSNPMADVREVIRKVAIPFCQTVVI
jgi:hypothetical protein